MIWEKSNCNSGSETCYAFVYLIKLQFLRFDNVLSHIAISISLKLIVQPYLMCSKQAKIHEKKSSQWTQKVKKKGEG